MKSLVLMTVLTLLPALSFAVTAPVPPYGTSGAGYTNLLTVPETRTSPVIELADGSQLVATVSNTILGTTITLHKLLPDGTYDLNWQTSGRRTFFALTGAINYIQDVIALVQVPAGFVVALQDNGPTPGLWLHGLDANGNDANILGGLSWRYVAIPGASSVYGAGGMQVHADIPSNRILVLGRYFGNANAYNFLGSLSFDGIAIPSFGSGGFLLNNHYQGSFMHSWDRFALEGTVNSPIYVAGAYNEFSITTADVTVTKLNSQTGAPVPGFGVNGFARLLRPVSAEWAPRIALVSGSVFIIAGRNEASGAERIPANVIAPLFSQTTIARVNPSTGQLVPTFGQSGWVDSNNPEPTHVYNINTSFNLLFTGRNSTLYFAGVANVFRPAYAGQIDITPNTAQVSWVPFSQCGPAGNDAATFVTQGSAIFLAGYNDCFMRPVVTKHLP